VASELRCGNCKEAHILGEHTSPWRGCPLTNPPLARFHEQTCWATPDQIANVVIDAVRKARSAQAVLDQALSGMTKEELEVAEMVARDVYHRATQLEAEAQALLNNVLARLRQERGQTQ